MNTAQERPRPRITLQIKISIVIALLVFVFGAVVTFFIYRMVTTTLTDTKINTISSLLIEQAHETESRMQSARNTADMVAKMPEVVRYLEQKSAKSQDIALLKLFNDLSLGRNLASLYVMDANGVALVSTDLSFVGNDFSFRRYVQVALKGSPFSEMAVGSVSKLPGFYFSAPIKNDTGMILGVIGVKLNPDVIFADLAVSKVKDFGNLFLVNADGVVIYSNREEFVYKSLFNLSEVSKREIEEEKRYPGVEVLPLDYEQAMKDVLSGENDALVYTIDDDIEGRKEFVGINKVGEFPYYLVSEGGRDDVLSAVTRISIIISGVILLTLISIVLSQAILMKILLRPLEKLEKYAARVSEGNFDESIEINTGDELQSLTESIKGMVGNLKGLYFGLEQQVKDKTSEISAALSTVEGKNLGMENSKMAMMNVMEDLEVEKEKIADDKNRIETILRSIGDGVFVTDENGKVVMVNQAAESMSGFSNMEMYGKSYSDVFRFSNEDDINGVYPDFVGEAIKEGKVGSLLLHTVLVKKDGTHIPVLDSAAPLRTLDGVVFGCVVVFRDNTQERELERSKDDFLSVASHQLRTPLGSMRWNLEMLLGGDLGEVSEEIQAIAKQIYDGNMRMIGLVNDLLDVSRIDQGRVMDNPIAVDLGQVIEETILEIEPLTMAKRVKVSSSIDKNAPQLTLDKKRIREVVENLISNAVKYNKVDGTVIVTLTSDSEKIEIVIADSGMGIPKKDMGKLFSKFFRAENAVRSETEGTGLGLYVVRKFVENWGGSLTVESEEGQGSKFTVRLPVDIKYTNKNN
jgi:PAS domain S-box-containing protein